MDATLFDTLKFADRLSEAGLERRQAEGMARVLGHELGGQVATRAFVRDELAPIREKLADADARFDAVDARFQAVDARFDAVDARFDAVEARVDARFDAVDARFDAVEARFDAVEARFDAVEARVGAVEARFDSVDAGISAVDAKCDAVRGELVARIDAVHREFDGRFKVLTTVMALGFTLLGAMGVYQVTSPPVDSGAVAAEVLRQLRLDEPATAAPDARG